MSKIATQIVQGALSACLVIMVVGGCAQGSVSSGAPMSAAMTGSAPVVPRSEAWTVASDVTGRRYQVFAAWPDAPAPEAGYAVFYVLDANRIFATVVETIRGYERRHPGGSPAVVVGIGYPDGVPIGPARAFDLTPAWFSEAEPPVEGGGADGFLQFIETELKPQIAARFAIDDTRETLFGHSFGGLLTLHALFNDPTAFDTYLAASPSVWWDGRLLLEEMERLGPKLETSRAAVRVLITVGEFEQVADPTEPDPDGVIAARAARLANAAQVDNARAVAHGLAQTPGLEVRFALMGGEDHGSVVPGAISRGVQFAFGPRVAPPEPAPLPADRAGATRIGVPSAVEYSAMTPLERYQLRLDVRTWPQTERRRFLSQLKYNLDAGLSFAAHHALHEERNAMDREFATRPVE